jgi:hypothetical protein
MSNSNDCKLFSHIAYTVHTDHHHTHESPKQYYSIQLSHTFNKDNIVLPCTKIIMPASLKKNFMNSYVIVQANRRDFTCHPFHTKRRHWATRLQVTPSWPRVVPLFLFPGVHLSFHGVICGLCMNTIAKFGKHAFIPLGDESPMANGYNVQNHALPIVATYYPLRISHTV